MRTSIDGIRVLQHFEDCDLNAYPDPGSHDGCPWTIGWGHTGPEVCKGLCWTQEQADEQLAADLAPREEAVSSMVRVSLSQRNFDALVLFVFNVGEAAFHGSTLLRKLNAGDYAGAAEEFPRWNKNDGQVMHGLTRRRAAERALFLGCDADHAIAVGDAA